MIKVGVPTVVFIKNKQNDNTGPVHRFYEVEDTWITCTTVFGNGYHFIPPNGYQ